MEAKQYAERDIVELDDYYVRHVHAMTAENLHRKSAIAAELAHRDMLTDTLLGALLALDALRGPFSKPSGEAIDAAWKKVDSAIAKATGATK